MLSDAAGQVERFDQRHAQDIAVEVHGAGHIRTHQRDMVDAAEFEFGIAVVRLDHPRAPVLRRRASLVPWRGSESEPNITSRSIPGKAPSAGYAEIPWLRRRRRVGV